MKKHIPSYSRKSIMAPLEVSVDSPNKSEGSRELYPKNEQVQTGSDTYIEIPNKLIANLPYINREMMRARWQNYQVGK